MASEDDEFGGVYLGPTSSKPAAASDRPPSDQPAQTPRTPTTPGPGEPLPSPSEPTPRPAEKTRVSSLRKKETPQRSSFRDSFRRKPKEVVEPEGESYGGVYLGPASSIPQVTIPVPVSKGGDSDDEAEPKRSASLIRRLSKSAKSPRTNSMPSKGKVKCEVCKKKCSGDILRADDKFFHIACFACKACNRPLSEVGFFVKDGDYFCPSDYHNQFGARCPTCGQFVEGEIVEFLGKTFHKLCFICTRCSKTLPSGESVTWTGREQICADCLGAAEAAKRLQAQTAAALAAAGGGEEAVLDTSELHQQTLGDADAPQSPVACASCGHLIQTGQVLLALGLHWHINCFKCSHCAAVLHGEYMSKEAKPYCIRDYNAEFGVRCHECQDFIAGRVLQAGGYQFHPTCAQCSRCGEAFRDGAEMYMQGDEIWHPSCNDLKPPQSILHKRTTSPHRSHSPKGRGHTRRHSAGASDDEEPRREYNPKYTVDFGKHLTYMYLLPEPTQGYLKQPIGPHPPLGPNFHHPQGGPVKIRRSRAAMLKTGMQRLTEQLEADVPRPKSPHMDNEEPIEMATYPAAHAPQPGEEPAIDRDDFPAPPYPYAVEEIRRRLSESEPEEEDEFPDEVDSRRGALLEKAKKAEEELKKLQKDSSLIHQVVLDLEEDSKKKKMPLYVDPRSASRTPSAKKLPHFKCRYESATNASPSRYQNRPKPWEHWQAQRAQTTAGAVSYAVPPKPGYGLGKASTLPVGSNGYDGVDMEDGTIEGAHSRQSLGGLGSAPDGHGGRMGGTMPLQDAGQRFTPSYGQPQIRSSLPDMSKPIRIYPYEHLLTTNKDLPEDADRCHLERHLPKEEFLRLFDMTPMEFYKLPEWKRIKMKRELGLF